MTSTQGFWEEVTEEVVLTEAWRLGASSQTGVRAIPSPGGRGRKASRQDGPCEEQRRRGGVGTHRVKVAPGEDRPQPWGAARPGSLLVSL